MMKSKTVDFGLLGWVLVAVLMLATCNLIAYDDPSHPSRTPAQGQRK